MTRRTLAVGAAGIAALALVLAEDAPRETPSHRPAGPHAATPRPDPGPQPSDWFLRQRAFPYDDVPEPARRRAMREASALQALARTPGVPSWTLVGPTNISGRITAIAASEATPGSLYAGAAAGGVFRSFDGGQSFVPIFDDQPSLSIGAIAVDPNDPLTVYVGTGEANAAADTYAGTGIYRSTDAGASWTSLGLEATAKIARIVVDPNDSDRIFVAAMGRLFSTNPERGLYATSNGGQSWDRVLFVNDSTGVVDVVFHPARPNIVYAASWERIRRPADRKSGGLGSGIHRSFDGGNNWTRLGVAEGLPAPSLATGRIGLTQCAADPDVLYAMYIDHPGNFDGIYRSDDGGFVWQRVNDGVLSQLAGSFGWYFGQIRVSPSDPSVVWALGIVTWRSNDAGQSWTLTTFDVHVDHHALHLDRDDPGLAILGTDGGVYTSADAGAAWTHRPFPITQFYAITADAQLPFRVYGGTQDNGTLRTPTGALDDWEMIFGGDGFYTIVDPLLSTTIYAESQFGGLGKSIDDGNSWSTALTGIPSERRNWSTPVVMDPSDRLTLYYGTFRVFKTENGASSWFPISGDLTGGDHPGALQFGTITTIDVSPVDPAVILAGTDDGFVWITTNGGLSWTEISGPLPDRWVTRVVCDRTNPDVAYVTFSGFRLDESLPHVFRTDDAGLTFTNISTNLPSIPLNDLVADDVDGNVLYVASDIGVWMTQNLGKSWAPLGAGLPESPVFDIHLVPGERSLLAGTHGRSIYAYDLDAAVSVGPLLPPRADPVVRVAPHPLSDRATLAIEVPVEGRLIVEIFDLTGRLVRRVFDGYVGAGVREIAWDGTDAAGREVPNGVYLHRTLGAGGRVAGKIVVAR